MASCKGQLDSFFSARPGRGTLRSCHADFALSLGTAVSGYKPLKVGTRVVWTVNGKIGRIKEMFPETGHALVRFANGEKIKIMLAFLKKKPPLPLGRKRMIGQGKQEAQFESYFGQVILAKLKELRMSQKAFAEEIGISRITLRQAIQGPQGALRIKTIEGIASALGISPRDFWSPAILESSDVASPVSSCGSG